MKTTMIVTYCSDDDRYISNALIASNEISLSSQWILNFSCPYYIYYREELFDSLESIKDYVHLSNKLSCAIKNIKTSSLKVCNGTVKTLSKY